MLRDVRIDESSIEGVTDGRRDEWRLARSELLEEHVFGVGEPFVLALALRDGGAVLRLELGHGHHRTIHYPGATLRPHLDEYTGICRTLARLDDEGAASPRLEALDMAKKVAHDAAARTLIAHGGALAPDHATARRLFTLLLTLLVDTTKLTMLHRHHR